MIQIVTLEIDVLQSTEGGNLVKVFWWEEGNMANIMFKILDCFSSEWVMMF